MIGAQRTINRRAMLMGMTGAAATAILAACGGSATSTPAPAVTAAPTSAAGAAATATKAPSAATASTGAVTVAPAATTAASSAVGGSVSGTSAVGSATSGSAALAQPTFGPIAGGATIQLTGAGSTFINPLLTIWADTFKKNVANNVSINYQSIGSGGGIQQITQKTVDFGASDAPMTDDQIKAAPGILHVPMVHGPVVATYNLKQLNASKPLQFSGQTLVDIYFGNITKWNDKAIAADNPGVTLPNTDIAVVYRSDGSGTTSIWVDYFSKISADWKSKVGTGTSVKFPVGIGAKGNEGVSGQVLQVDGGIGYVELAYAIQNKLPLSAVKNAAGEFITPSAASGSLAAALSTYPDDLRFSITNPPAEVKGAYPITGTTWLLVYTQQTDANKATALVDFVRWAISPAGDEVAKANNYPPIPAPLKAKDIVQLMKLTISGAPVFK